MIDDVKTPLDRFLSHSLSHSLNRTLDRQLCCTGRPERHGTSCQKRNGAHTRAGKTHHPHMASKDTARKGKKTLAHDAKIQKQEENDFLEDAAAAVTVATPTEVVVTAVAARAAAPFLR